MLPSTQLSFIIYEYVILNPPEQWYWQLDLISLSLEFPFWHACNGKFNKHVSAISIHLSACHNSRTAEGAFMKLHIGQLYQNLSLYSNCG
jgi:hypothetical protein